MKGTLKRLVLGSTVSESALVKSETDLSGLPNPLPRFKPDVVGVSLSGTSLEMLLTKYVADEAVLADTFRSWRESKDAEGQTIFVPPTQKAGVYAVWNAGVSAIEVVLSGKALTR